MNTARLTDPLVEMPQVEPITFTKEVPKGTNAKLLAKLLKVELLEVMEMAENYEEGSVD